MHHNPVTYLDIKLIGENHLYKGEGFPFDPEGFPFDPEGFLSTFPAVATVIGGYYAGILIQKKGKTYEGLSQILLIGFFLVAIAFLWNYGFPINKKM